MVSVTENAAFEIKKVLSKENKSDFGLRISITGAGCMGPEYGIGLEQKPKGSDVVFESHGIKIFVGEDVAAELNGSIIEYKETPQGSSFVINNPNTHSGCSGSCC